MSDYKKMWISYWKSKEVEKLKTEISKLSLEELQELNYQLIRDSKRLEKELEVAEDYADEMSAGEYSNTEKSILLIKKNI